jgi:hypothetical protein
VSENGNERDQEKQWTGDVPHISKEEVWNLILKYKKGIKLWRDEILNKTFRNIDAAIGIRNREGCKNNKKFWEELIAYFPFI